MIHFQDERDFRDERNFQDERNFEDERNFGNERETVSLEKHVSYMEFYISQYCSS